MVIPEHMRLLMTGRCWALRGLLVTMLVVAVVGDLTLAGQTGKKGPTIAVGSDSGPTAVVGDRTLAGQTGKKGPTIVVGSDSPPAAVAFGGGDAEKPKDPEEQLLDWLSELSPLHKVHYSWPPEEPFLSDPDDPLLYEYVRLTHAITVGEGATWKMVDTAVQVCAEINATRPRIQATLAAKYSPYHREFRGVPPTEFGPVHDLAVRNYTDKFEKIRAWIDQANARHGTSIWVSYVILNCERFHVKEGDDAWNHSMRVKYDLAYDVAKGFFPRARVEWFNYGAVHRGASDSGWLISNLWTLEEKCDGFSTALYRIPEIGLARESFRRTVELAREYGVDDVTPWVALGAGFKRSVHRSKVWTFDWDYERWYSWRIGAEINKPWYGNRPDRFAPWHAATAVAFYPAPFFDRSPNWGEHFVAYVRGANWIKRLP